MKKVMIIDDSALMRRVLSDIINDDEQLVVENTANNGLEALTLLRSGSRPDILLVDINMPRMDGVQLLKELNKYRFQIPVLIVSSIASQSADETIEALALGAFDFVKKPNGSIGGGYREFRKKVLLRIYMACHLPLPKKDEPSVQEKKVRVPNPEQKKSMPVSDRPVVKKKVKKEKGKIGLAVIASSTGGPKALQSVIPYFPKDFPLPLVVVQHMPAGFTKSLADRLNEVSNLYVKEAQDGDCLEKGTVYIAQGGKQCEVVEDAKGNLVLSENDKPARGGLKPCADIFFESLLSCSVSHIVCGVLTGMGSDGCKGIAALKECKDIQVVAQNEDTCVVYGMPRAVVSAGIVNEVVSLEDVADTMIKHIGV